MNEYLCEWSIDISADTPQEAAELAEKFMRESIESTWIVTSENGDTKVIDITT